MAVRMGITRAVPVLALALVAATGCQPDGGGDGAGGSDGSGSPGSSGSSSDGSGPGGPATIPPQLLECGDPSADSKDDGGKDGTDAQNLLLTDTDLTQATWTMPEGFEEAFGYVEDNPVETLEQIWVAEPAGDAAPSLNVINVVVYSGLDWGALSQECAQVPLSAVEERLAGYREQIDAEPLTDAEMTEVAGLPAITQQVGLSDYDYLGYWLFSRSDLVHVYCQWTAPEHRSVIEDGCADLVASVRLG
ncbi:hypothetical protein LQF12_07500 [Ruania suaedae]|uniref:hypothetical protein n=1 Tax=Ruania suaedae TaxID=2897774 RepID=UPI001E4A0874|nr:hypothetical protein [Ruania suaedae]UFU04409.1 hypothetical protein LQF12_07500 [Ruania suaedae]